MATIGYARKSKGKERINTRCKLLNEMVHRLRTRCLCTEVYVSPYCDANQPLESRDNNENYARHMGLIRSCDGDMSNLLLLLKTKFKPIRLVVIDFAGLSTESNYIRAFIRYSGHMMRPSVDKINLFDEKIHCTHKSNK
ncbi:uncharacterized protein BYT42DRAFT_503984 [Radiomyces spectabilis]|uniref:uncharacterized protein n=1 Tax=Radiomyces spectabilis TaxID=64574 RepID=UPI00221FD6CD|nr:uncharacterized protein BYT42DRAFT_503984 [Radiomyces spectabilis]KAI8368214.1 hypothetical protein BYT42DRAFT_503984 [Radiomyces spectabilis]